MNRQEAINISKQALVRMEQEREHKEQQAKEEAKRNLQHYHELLTGSLNHEILCAAREGRFSIIFGAYLLRNSIKTVEESKIDLINLVNKDGFDVTEIEDSNDVLISWEEKNEVK